MEKRITIAGCRTYTDYDEASIFINECIAPFQSAASFILLSGCCRGADRLGERFAEEHGWKVEYYPAQWKTYGRAAGPMRNKEMVSKCDLIICFWDGKSKGTASLIQHARKAGKQIAIKYVDV